MQVPMQEVCCGTSVAQSEGQIDSGGEARQHSFHTVLAVLNRVKEYMKRNNKVLEKMALKMDSLIEKVEKLE